MSAAALLAETPALPLHTAGKYVAAAYIVLFAIVLIYVAIMSARLGRVERELGELLQATEPGAASGVQHVTAEDDAAGSGGASAYPIEGNT